MVCFFPFSLQTCFLFCENGRDLEGWSLEASEPGCVMGEACSSEGNKRKSNKCMAAITRTLKRRTITLLTAPKEEYINENLEGHLQNPADNWLSHKAVTRKKNRVFVKFAFHSVQLSSWSQQVISPRDKMLIYWV